MIAAVDGDISKTSEEMNGHGVEALAGTLELHLCRELR